MSALKQNKKLSVMTGRMIPSHIRETKPEFEVFIKGFFKYLEIEGNPYDIITHIFKYGDIDETIDEYVKYFQSSYIADIPVSLAADFRVLVKNIRQYYLSKGTEDTFKFLLRFIFLTESSISYPKEDILKPSSGIWREPTYLRLAPGYSTNDLLFYLDTKVQGATSGATAYVERVEFAADPLSVSVLQFKLVESSIEGTFVDGESLNIIEANKDVSSYAVVDLDVTVNSVGAFTKGVGSWESPHGIVSGRDKIQDSYFYQDFSYVITSEVSLKFYKEVVKDILHPAGFLVFGDLQLSDDKGIVTDTLSNLLQEIVLAITPDSAPVVVTFAEDNTELLVTSESLIESSLNSSSIVLSVTKQEELVGIFDVTYDNTTLSIIDANLLVDSSIVESISEFVFEVLKENLFYSFSYFEANREDPIISQIFTPCAIEAQPLDAFVDRPNDAMEYFFAEAEAITSWPSNITTGDELGVNVVLDKNFKVERNGPNLHSVVYAQYDTTGAGSYVDGISFLRTDVNIPVTGPNKKFSTYQSFSHQYDAQRIFAISADKTTMVSVAKSANGGNFTTKLYVWKSIGDFWIHLHTYDIVILPISDIKSLDLPKEIAINADGTVVVVVCSAVTGASTTAADTANAVVFSGTNLATTNIIPLPYDTASNNLLEVSINGVGDCFFINHTHPFSSPKSALYENINGTWTKYSEFTNELSRSTEGSKISSDGNTIILSDYYYGNLRGRILLYEKTSSNPTVWTLTSTIIAPEPIDNGLFSRRLDMSDDGSVLFVAQTGTTVNGITNAGAVYILDRVGSSYVFRQKIVAKDASAIGVAGQLYGTAVQCDNDGNRVTIIANRLSTNGAIYYHYVDEETIKLDC